MVALKPPHWVNQASQPTPSNTNSYLTMAENAELCLGNVHANAYGLAEMPDLSGVVALITNNFSFADNLSSFDFDTCFRQLNDTVSICLEF